MTVTYSLEVARTRLGGFAKLLLRWRGSIYRLMYREMIIFTLLYYTVAVVYRYVLPETQKRSFEEIARYCREFTDLIPITFVMGFYVAVVVGRWWQQYLAIPWPDRCALQIAAYIQGNDERGRLIRRGLARYLNLLSVLTMQATSTVVRKRFPTVEHLLQAGLMTEEERLELEATVAPHGNWWIPASWFCQLAMQARKEGRIHDDLHLKSLIDDALTLRGNCGLMWSFDWISVPLVYTQVVTLAVYSFFAACLVGRQYLERATLDGRSSYAVDYYVPVFTFFQFFFYMGWLKVAEQLINPYGEDDDDFELSWIIDRNLQVSYSAADGLYQKYPKLVKDLFWDKTEPELPYTEAAFNFKTYPFLGSTMTMNIPPREKGWHINPIPEEARRIDPKIPNDSRRRTPVHAVVEMGVDSGRNTDDERPDSKSAPFRLFGTPRASSRPSFLSSLIKGDSRSSLNSRSASKTSINSIGTSAAYAHKSPTPAKAPMGSVDPASISRMESDVSGNWRYPSSNASESQTPQRQWSTSESPRRQHVVVQVSEAQNDAIPIVCIVDESRIDIGESPGPNRRVTFEENVDESISTGNNNNAGTDLGQALLLRASSSVATLVSDSGHGGSSQFDETDPPTGSDSEQLTINSRTFLLPNNQS